MELKNTDIHSQQRPLLYLLLNLSTALSLHLLMETGLEEMTELLDL